MAGKTDEELEAMFGISASRIAEIDAAALQGDLPGRAVGSVEKRRRGRPTMFEGARPVTFKVSESDAEKIDRRAEQLGLARSDYLRSLVKRDLAMA